MNDDFLWDCALEAQSNSRIDIIPGFEDDVSHFGVLQQPQACLLDSVCILKHRIDLDSIDICITESRDNGVLDIIGGELWEASFLLCSYILLNSEKFSLSSVLEIGAGVGLPVMLILALKTKLLCQSSVSKGVTLSDNDPRVIHNLCKSVSKQFLLSNSDSLNRTTVTVKLLDWSIFENIATSKSFIGDHNTDYDIIIGAELCYAPFHANCLSHLIR